MTDWPIDVFLCHNGQNLPHIEQIGRQLQEQGLRVWLDKWEVDPEEPWKPALDALMLDIGSVALFVGADGEVPWQDLDIQAFLLEFVQRDCPVIPVVLEKVGKVPSLPSYLKDLTYIDFRKYKPDPINELYSRISAKPEYVIPQQVEEPQPHAPTPPTATEPFKLEEESFKLGRGMTLEMVKIPAGTFLMGSPEGEEGSEQDERPQHEVKISGFSIAKFPITQAQWRAVSEWPKVTAELDDSPSGFSGTNRPVETIDWFQAKEFCDRLSAKTGRYFRLPSEAEWEYACRAGTAAPYYSGQEITEGIANYGEKRNETTDVGTFPPNPFGLYDMHGNVWEWCMDRLHDSYTDAPSNGMPWLEGGHENTRVVRGGAWNSQASNCRSAYRIGCEPDGKDYIIGFRVVCAS